MCGLWWWREVQQRRCLLSLSWNRKETSVSDRSCLGFVVLTGVVGACLMYGEHGTIREAIKGVGCGVLAGMFILVCLMLNSSGDGDG